MSVFRSAEGHGVVLSGAAELELRGLSAIEQMEWALKSCIALDREVASRWTSEDDVPDTWLNPHREMLDAPTLEHPQWLQDRHEELCLAGANLLLDEPFRQLVAHSPLEPESEVGMALIGLRVILHRIARLLGSELLDERLQEVDTAYQLIGVRLVAALDEYELMQRVLCWFSPALGKSSGWTTIEEFEDVLDVNAWWGYHARNPTMEQLQAWGEW